MPADVFLSYARATSTDSARAVRAALILRGVSVFVDERDIEHGDRFPERIVDALLAARVVVVFAEETYFARWYCVWEWRVARTPFLTVAARPGATPQDRAAALMGLVVALPAGGRAAALDRLPPHLQETNWPAANDADAVAGAVMGALDRTRTTLAERLDALSEIGGAPAARGALLETVSLPPPQSVWEVPHAPRGALPESLGERFVGRADALHILDDLLSGRAAGQPSAAALTGALRGMGGIGKTQLALEYLHRFGPTRFSGGLFWIDADQDASAVEVRHHEILRALNDARGAPTPSLRAYRDAEDGIDLRRDLLGALGALPRHRPVLVVIDNVPEPEPGAPPLPLSTWWPFPGRGAVLATSRLDLGMSEAGHISAVTLDVLDSASAVALLTGDYAGRGQVVEAEWRTVADWVGHLPLVLTLLNGALRLGGLAPTTLVERARQTDAAGPVDTSDAAYAALAGSVRADRIRGVSAAFELSYERLGPIHRDAARVLAQLAPAPIPTALLDALDALFAPAVRVTLTARSFVTSLPAAVPPMFGLMHRVLADYLRGRTDESEMIDNFAAVARGALLVVLTDDRCRDPRSWPFVNACLPHAEHLLPSSPPGAAGVAGGEGVKSDIVKLARVVWSARRSQGQVTDARRLVERAVEFGQRLLGADAPVTRDAMSDFAAALRDDGDLDDACAQQEQLVDAYTHRAGADALSALGIMQHLGITLGTMGDDARACALFQQVVDGSARLRGPEHRDTLKAIGTLAVTLGNRGNLDKSLELHQRTLEVQTRVLGSEDWDTLETKRSLASIRAALGDLPGARALCEQALEAFTRVLPPDHPNTLATMRTLAAILYGQGYLSDACQYLDAEYAAHVQTRGRAHPVTRDARKALETVLRALGDAAGLQALGPDAPSETA